MRLAVPILLLCLNCGSDSTSPERVTVADTGLLAADPGTLEDAVQVREAVAIENAYRALESAGIRTREDWQRSAAEFAETLSKDPLSREQMQARVEAELAGDIYEMPAPLSVATIVEKQTATAEDWEDRLRAGLPALSDEQLTAARIKITVGLAVLQTQSEANPDSDGIDGQILDIIRQANLRTRAAVIGEMQARGLTE